VKIAFAYIREHLKRDNQKYKNICIRNSENGKRGGRPKNPNNPAVKLVTQNNPEEPKKADTDSDSDSDSDTDTDTEIHSGKSADIPGVCFQISGLIKKHCQNQNRVHKGNRNKSANTIRLMQSSDKIDLEQIKGAFIRYMQLYTGAQYDPQIFSAESLRDKWNKLIDFINRQDQAKATEPEKPAFKEFGGLES
jgi:hypothetical protein